MRKKDMSQYTGPCLATRYCVRVRVRACARACAADALASLE
jgi:hypothetical protein